MFFELIRNVEGVLEPTKTVDTGPFRSVVSSSVKKERGLSRIKRERRLSESTSPGNSNESIIDLYYSPTVSFFTFKREI